MTRARAGGTGEEKFGHRSRALVWRIPFSGRWRAFRAYRDISVTRDTWAEALAYALEEDENND